MEMTRVLHIGEYVQGGVATYLDTLFSDRNGLDTYAMMSDEKSEHQWRLDDACVYYYPYQRGICSLLPAIFAVRKKVKEIQPDVIYCHSTWAGLIGRLPLLFAKTCRVVYNAHGWAFLRDTAAWKRQLYAAVERVLASVTDTIVNVSHYEYESAIRYGLPKDKMVVIYSGILDDKKEWIFCFKYTSV